VISKSNVADDPQLHQETHTMNKLISRFVKDESGPTAIEYGLIAGLIAVVIIGAVETVGGSVSSTFPTIANSLPGGEG
jgi:pilus assembly protein Flp/PilA